MSVSTRKVPFPCRWLYKWYSICVHSFLDLFYNFETYKSCSFCPDVQIYVTYSIFIDTLIYLKGYVVSVVQWGTRYLFFRRADWSARTESLTVTMKNKCKWKGLYVHTRADLKLPLAQLDSYFEYNFRKSQCWPLRGIVSYRFISLLVSVLSEQTDQAQVWCQDIVFSWAKFIIMRMPDCYI